MVTLCASGFVWLLRVARVVWLRVGYRVVGDRVDLFRGIDRVLQVSPRLISESWLSQRDTQRVTFGRQGTLS
jgi:hypothetical protein